MNDIPQLALALLAGLALGAFFFGGLWWTIKRGLVSPRAPLWFLGSFVIRIAVVLAGFYFVGQGRPERLVACLLGFIVARLIFVLTQRSHGASKGSQHSEDGRPRPSGQTGLRPVATAGDGCLPGQPGRMSSDASATSATPPEEKSKQPVHTENDHAA